MASKGGVKRKPTPCPGRGDSTKGLIPGSPAGKLETPTFICRSCGKVVRERANHTLDDHGVGTTVEKLQADLAYERLDERVAQSMMKPVRSKGGSKRAVVEGQSGS